VQLKTCSREAGGDEAGCQVPHCGQVTPTWYHTTIVSDRQRNLAMWQQEYTVPHLPGSDRQHEFPYLSCLPKQQGHTPPAWLGSAAWVPLLVLLAKAARAHTTCLAGISSMSAPTRLACQSSKGTHHMPGKAWQHLSRRKDALYMSQLRTAVGN